MVNLSKDVLIGLKFAKVLLTRYKWFKTEKEIKMLIQYLNSLQYVMCIMKTFNYKIL